MASFDTSINLLTRLDDAGVKKLFKSLKSIETLVNKINAKPLQAFSFKSNDFSAAVLKDAQNEISKIDTAFNKVAVSAGKAKNGFKNVSVQADLAKARYAAFGKSLNSALVEVQKYDEILQNIDLSQRNTTEVKRLAKAWAEGTKAARKYNEQLNDIKRKALGLQPQKQRDFEVARRKRLLQDRELERKAQEKTLALEKKQAREAEKRAKAAERSAKAAKAEAAAKKKARADRFENLALGAGFPLLFGGNLGSIVGGIAGSFVGKGFGGQIIGSAIGQLLNDAAVAAGEFAQAATKGATALDDLTQKLGLRGTQSQEQLGLLILSD